MQNVYYTFLDYVDKFDRSLVLKVQSLQNLILLSARNSFVCSCTSNGSNSNEVTSSLLPPVKCQPDRNCYLYQQSRPKSENAFLLPLLLSQTEKTTTTMLLVDECILNIESLKPNLKHHSFHSKCVYLSCKVVYESYSLWVLLILICDSFLFGTSF